MRSSSFFTALHISLTVGEQEYVNVWALSPQEVESMDKGTLTWLADQRIEELAQTLRQAMMGRR